MNVEGVWVATVLLLVAHIRCEVISESSLEGESNLFSNDSINKIYNRGVELGIINTTKYSLQSFLTDDTRVFRDIYKQFSLNDTDPITYENFLIINNFGLLPDTQESLFQRKISKRSTADNKRRFVNTVKKGDILITGHGIGGLVGHAAIMTSDYWVLEMPGGSGWQNGIKDNNRQISKHAWFDIHKSDWTTVYRNRNADVARAAAGWADRTYYNPNGGAKKTKHITYRLTTDFRSVSPSYCSKLVGQAYYYGTGKRQVVKNTIVGKIIVPTMIPNYFLSPYTLVNKGKF